MKKKNILCIILLSFLLINAIEEDLMPNSPPSTYKLSSQHGTGDL